MEQAVILDRIRLRCRASTDEGAQSVSDEFPDGSGESDIRRRAAWLLAMLAIVAALFVALMVTFLGNSGGDKPSVADPANQSTDAASPTGSTSPSRHSSAPSTHSTSRSSSSSPVSKHRRASCPSNAPCVLDGDIGDAVTAINAYRTQHGQKQVSGSVSKDAQTCALHNGSGCSGGWAETQVPKPDGQAAVTKILQFGKLLDPKMTSIEVGWAYDPGGKQYYFALIRND